MALPKVRLAALYFPPKPAYNTFSSNNDMPTFSVTDDLAWTVSKRPLSFVGNDGNLKPWSERVAVIRDDTEQCLGAVSPQYETVQNSELYAMIQPMVDEGLLTVENRGYLQNGASVFIQAKVNEDFRVIGEDYKSYITLLNGHVGNASVAIGSTAHRVICGNTFTMAMADMTDRYRHKQGINERLLESSTVLDYVNGAMKTYAEQVDKLATTQCTHSKFREAVEAIYQKDISKMRDSFVQQLDHLYYYGNGNSGSTLYDVFNAVTDYASNRSRKTVAGRFQYANFGAGDRINKRAMRVLTSMAA